MLTQETKRHIDSARQVLVGVVPNPSSQIDQITNALIYKFMDDMDQAAIKAGGDPSFFVGDLERYSWTRLMDSRLGNQERMNLYSEALMKFSEAKQLPDLFRGIFKSAFLPYRSPEVLGLFLKEIDYFDYSHSEELGNAYEYLLSIMGSQGDAGQFRTPRHIIDFIVEAVNPTKDDKVLDPACGTAGFLVSAYKHILEQHDGKNPDGSKNDEKPLTPDQRRAIMNNFEGYDVDPGMVRISQVNMYLHHFRNPKIYNYNTLSQDERWADKFDVILANPPFMSPKGGVSTHNKFSVPSSRSEVLFVDYIMNHLRPKGRAGIIVPEGIIFQSGTAHKQLRKNLIEDGLYAVVSLPSGVFNPYAGVKTSILLFDNELAKQSKEILFVKIQHDGTDLGAKKRLTKANDLSIAQQVIEHFKKGVFKESKIAHAVRKKIIIESGDYNFSGDRYRVISEVQSEFELVELGEILELSGKIRVGKNVYPIMSITMHQGLIDQSDKFKKRVASDNIENYKVVERDELVVGFPIDEGVLGFQRKYEAAAVSPAYDIWKLKKLRIASLDYLETVFRSDFAREIYKSKMQGAVSRRRSVPKDIFLKIKIPLPPFEIQRQIMMELYGYQNIIAGARQVVENWKPKIDIDPEWEKVRLGKVADYIRGVTFSKKEQVYEENEDTIRMATTKAAQEFGIVERDLYFIPKKLVKNINQIVRGGDILISIANSLNLLGRTTYIEKEMYGITFGAFMGLLRSKINKIQPKYLDSILRSEKAKEYFIANANTTTNISNLTSTTLLGFEIPLPSLEIQKQIVEKTESERTLVESAKKLIGIYEQKTKDVLSKLWAE